MAGVVDAVRTAWARGFGVTLRAAGPGDLEAPGMQRALRDGIERGYDGSLPAAPPGCECYMIRVAAAEVGVLGFVRGMPDPGETVVWGAAIAPEYRGHAYGVRALLAAERRLLRDGQRQLYARVPRTNGRGLYFMLRSGYAPVVAPVEDGATWFRRNLKPTGRSAAPPARGRLSKQRALRGSSADS